jgi:toxin ParE1/3/4
MTKEFRLTPPAIEDLKSIADYLAEVSDVDQADRFLQKVDQKLILITKFPNLGKARPEVLPGLRSLPLDRYLLLYTVSEYCVEILRVVSGYRDLQALFDESDR